MPNRKLSPHGYLNVFQAWNLHPNETLPVRVGDLIAYAKEQDRLDAEIDNLKRKLGLKKKFHTRIKFKFYAYRKVQKETIHDSSHS